MRFPRKSGRCTPAGGRRPLLRAVYLERALQTPAHIYYKYEGVSPAGSHKPNTAVAQAYFNKLAGTKPPGHGDRRRPVGLLPGYGLPPVRPGMHGLHGRGQLPPQALSPNDDGNLGRHRAPQPQRPDPIRAAGAVSAIRSALAAWASPSARRIEDAGVNPHTHYSAWAACSTTSACTRP